MLVRVEYSGEPTDDDFDALGCKTLFLLLSLSEAGSAPRLELEDSREEAADASRLRVTITNATSAQSES